jgi:hypothetical protein
MDWVNVLKIYVNYSNLVDSRVGYVPKNVVTFNVFISSPSNLNAERLIIEKVLAELSHELTAGKNVAFEVFNWESDAIPGIGLEAQEVINSQLNYDIYIGILGSVFGTPTKHYGSGTEEEFSHAYERYRNAPDTVRVLFYFKNNSDNVFNISIEQLSKVRAFRSKLGDLGVLYHDFSELDSLREMVRTHVRNLILKQWNGNNWRVLSPPNSIASPKMQSPESSSVNISVVEDLTETKDEEALGLLENAIVVTDAAKALQEHMARMTDISQGLAGSVTSAAEGINESRLQNDLVKAKIVFDRVAGQIKSFTQDMRSELSVYNTSSADILTSLGNISALFFDEKTGSREEIESMTRGFQQLRDTLRGVRSTLQQFHEILDSTPSMTYEFRAARKYLSRVVDEFISSYTIFLGSADLLIANIRQKLDEGEQPVN